MPRSSPRAVAFVFEHFGSLRDRRIDRRKFHTLPNILVMALCGAIAGVEGWSDLALFAQAKEAWFRQFLDLKRGTPSADTFRRVFSRLDPQAFEACFRNWVTAIAQDFAGEVIAIDGKALRGAIEKAGSTTPLHLVHVWATSQQLLLAQAAVAGAPGEVAAIPQLLQLLDLEGAIVSIDANGATPTICAAIKARGAEYVIAAKGNRAALHNYLTGVFDDVAEQEFKGSRVHRSSDRGHGRREKRVVRTVELKDIPAALEAKWTGLRTGVMVERTRVADEKASTEKHFYISSLPADPERIGNAIRSHWGIENHLHWTLDVAFGEDRQRIRDQNGAQNFALINRIALMLLKADKTQKISVRQKRKLVGWESPYLGRILTSGKSIS